MFLADKSHISTTSARLVRAKCATSARKFRPHEYSRICWDIVVVVVPTPEGTPALPPRPRLSLSILEYCEIWWNIVEYGGICFLFVRAVWAGGAAEPWPRRRRRPRSSCLGQLIDSLSNCLSH